MDSKTELNDFISSNDDFDDKFSNNEDKISKSDVVKALLASLPQRKISSPRYDVFSKEDYFMTSLDVPLSSSSLIQSNTVTQADLDSEFEHFSNDISFKGISLVGLDFRHRSLSHIIFRDCDLCNCNFSSCDLSHAHFINCTCSGANFNNCNFSSAWLYFCDFLSCDFSFANLCDCYFDRSFLNDADFSGVNFTSCLLFKPHSLPKGFYRIAMNDVYLRDFILDTVNDCIYSSRHSTLKGPDLLCKLKKFIFEDIPDSLKSSPVYQNEAKVTYDIIEKLYLGIGKSDNITDEKNSSSDGSDVTGSDNVIEDEGDKLARFRPKSELGNFESTPVIDKKIVFTVSLILLFIFIVSYFYALFNDAPKGGF